MEKLDIKDCIDTFEKAQQRLENVEKQLAKQLKLNSTKNIREQLITLAKSGKLVETRLVADWHDAYSWYINW